MKKVEEQLELFLLLMGALAVTVSGQWSAALLHGTLREPLPIAGAVLVAGLLFQRLRLGLRAWSEKAQRRFGVRALAFILVLGLGLLSCAITAIVAALVLAEAARALRLPRQTEVRLVVLACYAIGLGSALTPLGGPLAAIAISRLQGGPYHADFFFLARLLGAWIAPLMLAFAGAAALLVRPGAGQGPRPPADPAPGRIRDEAYRALKVYGFVAGLVLLGQGFAPLADRFLAGIPTPALYWVNSLSAVLDNATLAAAEIGPALPPDRLRALLMGLLLAGGMLIPGNLPNIIAAGKLGLGSREWARFALPVGLAAMSIFFACLLLA